MKTNTKAIIIPDFMVMLKTINKFGVLSVSDLHYETKITYSHLHNIKKYFAEKNWINIEKEGVRHLLSLTPIGKDMVKAINSLLGIMKITDENLLEFRKKSKLLIRETEKETEDPENKYRNSYAGVKITERNDEPVNETVDPHITPEEDIPKSKVEYKEEHLGTDKTPEEVEHEEQKEKEEEEIVFKEDTEPEEEETIDLEVFKTEEEPKEETVKEKVINEAVEEINEEEEPEEEEPEEEDRPEDLLIQTKNEEEDNGSENNKTY